MKGQSFVEKFFTLNTEIGKTRRAARFKLGSMNRETSLQAIFERDTRFDGHFVYGVSTTRIFCRASCPSRRPKPENIALFASVEAAQEAGFRACLRCQPQNLGRELTKNGESRAFENAAGIANKEWQELERMERFKTEIRSGKSVIEAQNEAGFGSSRALYQRAPSVLGMTPASYGKGGAGAAINFAISSCELGEILVARTTIGVCSVALGDDEFSLETALRAEFFAAQIARDDAKLGAEIEAVLRLLRGQEPSALLPLDVRATAFQARVWRELTKIARGETVSYGELAQRLEMPKSVRAVAAACGKNPVALVHPCHRVVGKSGELTGYRWGIERKRALLNREK
ncbi:DNA-O6-methylguanine--protein-cysteine S-methyltransferase /Transcriptional regulator Ada [Abditibacterium utsteinense]|uniref:methylated-DNA--[protein]-cysteine S-methyltransferase n=1 Tax=Abditibacterium utsteinense TaxID=1960156 RepID=A0A2S8SS38_9BACT|nr:methylated-DNA--[protein]-cysteine S-methyltransferase [Abditibacterium utsteinense]PQV63623.1 DNA-O6-methylguanine--protein-cysteine S-methyltransferase /Transcriptional regulator Ada [Abditibacterium utsteinense]